MSRKHTVCILALAICAACAAEKADESEDPIASPSNEDSSNEDSSDAEPSVEAGANADPESTAEPVDMGDMLEPATSTAARGAVSLHIAASDTCSLGDVWADFPAGSGRAVTASEHGALAEHLTRDAAGAAVKVTCNWLPTEDPVQVLLGISTTSETDVSTASMMPVLSPSGPQEGRIMFHRNSSEPSYGTSGDERCMYSIVELDRAGGTVWGSVQCAQVSDLEGTEQCEVTEGYFYFENCTDRI